MYIMLFTDKHTNKYYLNSEELKGSIATSRTFPVELKKKQHLESTCHNVTGVYKIESLSINSSAEQIALNAPFVVFFLSR